MSDTEKVTNQTSTPEEEVSAQESTLAEGLFCFHAISKDMEQRFNTYRLYKNPTDQQVIIQDASDWYRMSMKISEVNESFNLLITKVC